MTEEKEEKPHIEIELGDDKRKIYLIIDKDEKIWVDLKGLPSDAELCMLFDGGPIIVTPVGEARKEKRTFVPIEWAITDWGGDDEIVEALKKRKQMTLEELPRLKKKYWDEKDEGR